MYSRNDDMQGASSRSIGKWEEQQGGLLDQMLAKETDTNIFTSDNNAEFDQGKALESFPSSCALSYQFVVSFAS